MIHHPDQLYSLVKIYHQEALHQAQGRHLAHQAKADRRPRSVEQQGLWSRLGKLATAAVRLW
jgi:hypothetical protein